VYTGRDTKVARQRLAKALWLFLAMDFLGAGRMTRRSTAVQDLRSPPNNRLETLKGDQAGRFSIRVNQQYRVTFRFQGGQAFEVRCEDYHR
jgi:plasmid maintenance system killer protein